VGLVVLVVLTVMLVLWGSRVLAASKDFEVIQDLLVYEAGRGLGVSRALLASAAHRA
jgi:hypothetical protein